MELPWLMRVGVVLSTVDNVSTGGRVYSSVLVSQNRCRDRTFHFHGKFFSMSRNVTAAPSTT